MLNLFLYVLWLKGWNSSTIRRSCLFVSTSHVKLLLIGFIKIFVLVTHIKTFPISSFLPLCGPYFITNPSRTTLSFSKTFQHINAIMLYFMYIFSYLCNICSKHFSKWHLFNEIKLRTVSCSMQWKYLTRFLHISKSICTKWTKEAKRYVKHYLKQSNWKMHVIWYNICFQSVPPSLFLY